LSCSEEVPAKIDRGKTLDIVRGLHPQGALKALYISSPRRFPKGIRLDILAIWENYPIGIRVYRRKRGEMSLFVLAVDKGLFERDVEEAFLGDVIAAWLLAPYEELVGSGYLWKHEVLFKRRKVEEAMTRLALEYPHLSLELLIEPNYFLFEPLCKITQIYPPITSIYIDFEGESHENAVEASMVGYGEVFREIVQEGKLHFRDGYLLLDRDFIEEAKKHRFRAINFLKMVDKSLRPYLIRVFSKVAELLSFYPEVEVQSLIEGEPRRIKDPKTFLHLSTTLGIVSLSEATGIEDFIKRMEPLGKVSDVKLEPCGGVLNDVYLLRFGRGDMEEKALVKKYQNWVGFKWFPLALWTLGTQNFSVLGRSRLEREYAISSLLQRQGCPVPSVYHVNLNRLILIREFVEGENLVDTVRDVLLKGESFEGAGRLRSLGGLVAQVHSLGVTIGDCKPENFIASSSEKIYIIDLEQGADKGNPVWDLAELLYYSGHYASISTNLEYVSDLAKMFTKGYLEGGGDPKKVAAIGGIQYTKVFSLFTLPQVIYTISKTCREEASR